MSPYIFIYFLKDFKWIFFIYNANLHLFFLGRPAFLALNSENAPLTRRPNDALRDLFEEVPPTNFDYAILKTELNEGRDLRYFKDDFENELNSIWKFSG